MSDGHIDNMATTTVSKMATWTRWRLPECLIWLHGQDGDYHSVLDGYIDNMATTTESKMATWKDDDYNSVSDGYMD